LQRLHVPRAPETSATVAWSANGRTIAIAEEARPLYLKTLGGSLKRLTRYEASAPAWSPSGRRIAYVSTRDRLTVVDADGRGRRSLGGWGISTSPSWSPDGRYIALADRGIVLVDMRTGRRQRVTRRIGDNEPVWSPDGALIAFQRLISAYVTEIFVVRPTGPVSSGSLGAGLPKHGSPGRRTAVGWRTPKELVATSSSCAAVEVARHRSHATPAERVPTGSPGLRVAASSPSEGSTSGRIPSSTLRAPRAAERVSSRTTAPAGRRTHRGPRTERRLPTTTAREDGARATSSSVADRRFAG
jgi:WD40-like Beta Propeller Repeat